MLDIKVFIFYIYPKFDFMEEHLLDQLKDCKVLVTGGAGFIGANLCEFLLENHSIVYCLDNFATGKKENLSNCVGNTNFHFIEGDIRSLGVCQAATRGVDYVLHQAALGSVPRSIKDPITTNQVNVGGFLNMLIASRDNNVKRFIYAASSSTYGDSTHLPKVEENIGQPLSPYAITKYVNELYANVFFKTYGLDSIGLRYFNVFGRKQDSNGAYAAVIPKFTKQLIAHEPLLINGDGNFSRDFTYVDNVIEMNVRAMLTSNREALNTVYNVACGARTTLNDLIAILKEELTAFDSHIINVDVKNGPERAGDVPHSHASIEKAKTLLGYHPKFMLRQGLHKSMKWYWKNLK